MYDFTLPCAVLPVAAGDAGVAMALHGVLLHSSALAAPDGSVSLDGPGSWPPARFTLADTSVSIDTPGGLPPARFTLADTSVSIDIPGGWPPAR
jgi:hypothetical protein